jgi:hypothetical protein
MGDAFLRRFMRSGVFVRSAPPVIHGWCQRDFARISAGLGFDWRSAAHRLLGQRPVDGGHDLAGRWRGGGFARNSAALRVDWLFLWLGTETRLECRGGLGPHYLLGLERLEEPQRAPQLGERRAAIAQQGVERPRAVAVADQRKPEVALAVGMALEQLGLDPLGALEPPGGAGDARGEHGLERALRRQLLEQRRLERFKLGGTLARQHDVLLRAQAVLEGVLRRARLAFRRLGSARFRTVPAAGLGARAGQAKGWHHKIPSLAGESGPEETAARRASLTGNRNIVHSSVAESCVGGTEGGSCSLSFSSQTVSGPSQRSGAA